jgi:threonine dehydrogenase-like Zn-dependent dehydrogenase
VVAVVGCGMIGIATIVALRSLGFKGEIVGIEKSKRQAEVARRFGASNVITDDPIEEFASLIGGRVHKSPRWEEDVSRRRRRRRLRVRGHGRRG